MAHVDYFKNEVRTILHVKDLKAMHSFYHDILELPVIYSWNEGEHDSGYHFSAAAGVIEILNRVPETEMGPTTIMLEADNVDDCYERLVHKEGIEFFEHLADRPYGIRMFQLIDPERNVIVIFSWSRDVMEYRQGWKPRVDGLFLGEYRAIAYVEQSTYLECLSFYRDILRLRACYTWDYGPGDRGHKFVIGKGDCTLEVLCRKDPMPQGKGTLMFEAEDVDACYEAIVRKAGSLITVTQKPIDQPYGIRMFCLKDPNGNDVEIFSYLKDKKE